MLTTSLRREDLTKLDPILLKAISGREQIGQLYPRHDFQMFRTMPPGDIIHREAKSDLLFWVIDGVLLLQGLLEDGRRHVLDFRYPGECLCSEYNRHLPELSAVAVTSVRLLCLTHEIVRHLAKDNPELEDLLTHSITMQFEGAILRGIMLAQLRVEERVTFFVLETALRQGKQIANGIEVKLPMTREDIGDYLGLNANTVSRSLSKLKKQKVIHIDKVNTILIPDLKILRGRNPLAMKMTELYGGRSLRTSGWKFPAFGQFSRDGLCPYSNPKR